MLISSYLIFFVLWLKSGGHIHPTSPYSCTCFHLPA